MLAKSFIIACEDPALTWFTGLTPGSIYSWEQLKAKVLQNFQGFNKYLLSSADLFACKQEDREPLPQYFKRFIHLNA